MVAVLSAALWLLVAGSSRPAPPPRGGFEVLSGRGWESNTGVVYENGSVLSPEAQSLENPIPIAIGDQSRRCRDERCGTRYPTKTSSSAARSARGWPRDDYLVLFKRYHSRGSHRGLIAQAVGDDAGAASGDWKLVERANPAAGLPSDFAVIRLSPAVSRSCRRTVLARLRQAATVRAVTTEKIVTRTPLSHFGFDAGRPSTRWSDATDSGVEPDRVAKGGGRRRPMAAGGRRAARRGSARTLVTERMGADQLWSAGYTGVGIKVAIFDTGLRAGHPHFENVEEWSNWTEEPETDDKVGHGSFVAGLVASTASACPGFAPGAELHVFKVFTSEQKSYTSWFLDAFNYAIQRKVHIVNLSIGGPDFMDIPFVDKVNELCSAGIILISAIGNDGPIYGTLNNPADMAPVIGVGGITYDDEVAPFSSRGMTTWELPGGGYGRFKPDIVSYGNEVYGSAVGAGCRTLSGTSVASPVVTGAAALLASVVPPADRPTRLTPASLKQALLESAERLPGPWNVFEQGRGKLNLSRARDILRHYTPRASVTPPALDAADCPYAWPYCSQPLFAGGMAVTANFTILNGLAVTGWVTSAVWHPDRSQNGELLQVSIDYSETIWPWAGWLGLRVVADPSAARHRGFAAGVVELTVSSERSAGAGQSAVRQHSTVRVPVRFAVVPPPKREKRLLWDQFHSVAYPPGYFPRDNLGCATCAADPLDWNGDHPHTNFRTTYTRLRELGYYIDVLDQPYTCFDATAYGALLVFDTEDEFHEQEVGRMAPVTK